MGQSGAVCAILAHPGMVDFERIGFVSIRDDFRRKYLSQGDLRFQQMFRLKSRSEGLVAKRDAAFRPIFKLRNFKHCCRVVRNLYCGYIAQFASLNLALRKNPRAE
jgi:hypothetical protein